MSKTIPVEFFKECPKCKSQIIGGRDYPGSDLLNAMTARYEILFCCDNCGFITVEWK